MLISNPKTQSVTAYIDSLSCSSKESVLIFIGEGTNLSISKIIKHCNLKSISLAGGIFPAVIIDNKVLKNGIIIKKISTPVKPILFQEQDKDYYSILKEHTKNNSKKHQTGLILIDGLFDGANEVLFDLYNYFGENINYFGGGTGTTQGHVASIINNEGIFKNASLICLIKERTNIGIKHGWECIPIPILATSTDKNIIHKLNWKSPFSTYKKIIESETNIKITKKNFNQVAFAFPFGIYAEDAEYVIRDPIELLKDGSIKCISEIPEHSIIYIFKANKENIIDAAGRAAKMCTPFKKPKQFFIIDCVSRYFFLEKRFKEELTIINKNLNTSQSKLKLEGVLSMGEIASNGDGYLDIFNKTVVLSVLY